MGPRRRRSRRRARGQAGPGREGPHRLARRPVHRLHGAVQEETSREIATRREAPTTTTTTSSRDRRPSPRHRPAPDALVASDATTRGLAPRTRVHTPHPKLFGRPRRPDIPPASARARANIYTVVLPACSRTFVGGRPHWIRRAKNIPETTFSGSQFVEILRYGSTGSSFCFDTKCEDIRISAAANQRPRTEQSAEDCALVGGGSGTKASSHPALAAYQHPVHTLVVNVTTAAMAAFVTAAPSLPPAPRSRVSDRHCVRRVVFRAMTSAPRYRNRSSR